MPTIKTYQTQESAQGGLPSARASAGMFGAGAGDGLAKGLESTAVNLTRVAEQQESSDLRVKYAQARAKWTVELAERAQKAPSGDTAFAQKFAEDMQADIGKLGEGVSTRAGRLLNDQLSAGLVSDFVAKAGVAQATSMGNKALQDYFAMEDAHRNTVRLDPTQFNTATTEMMDALRDPNGPYAMIPGDKREELERKMLSNTAVSAVEGWIKLNPDAAERRLKGGEFSGYLDADQTDKLLGQIDTEKRARLVEAERRKRLDKEAKEKEQEKTKSDFVMKWAEGSLSTKNVLDSNLDAKDKEHYINLIEKQIKEDDAPPKSGNSAASDMFSRIYLPDDDPRKLKRPEDIDQAFIDRRISREDMIYLRKEYEDYRAPDGRKLGDEKKKFLDGQKKYLAKNTLLKNDPQGEERFWAYGRMVDEFVRKYRAEGKDPYDLFDASKPDFLGKPEIRKNFEVSFDEAIKYTTQRMKPPSGPNARRPGETIADWRKRTGN